MFNDELRDKVWNEIRQHDEREFAKHELPLEHLDFVVDPVGRLSKNRKTKRPWTGCVSIAARMRFG